MQNLFSCLLKNFNISEIAQNYLDSDKLKTYYKDSLIQNNKRTRSDSKISPDSMIIFIFLWILNPDRGYKSVLNSVKLALCKYLKSMREIIELITDSGLCKARKRFSSDILKKLWQNIICNFIEQKKLQLWKGFQVCVIDGTAFILNKTEEILEEYPLLNNARFPRLFACVLYDMLSKIPLDIAWGHNIGERSLLIKLLGTLKEKSLLILDRGYPAVWLFFILYMKNINFIIRLPKTFRIIKIKRIKKNDWFVKIILPPYNAYMKKIFSLEEYNALPKEIICRKIISKLYDCEPRVLLVSLIDTNEYSYKEINNLYCERWRVETYFKDLKHVIKIEKFHAQYVDGIYQELYAAMLLTIMMKEYIILAAKKYNKYVDNISFKKIFDLLSDFFILLIFTDNVRKLLKLFLIIVAESGQKKRPGRHYQRNFYRLIKCKTNKWK